MERKGFTAPPVIKHDNMEYKYVKDIDSIGTIMVTLYEEPTTAHRIAVKFDSTGRSQSFNNEEINLKKIRQKNPDVLHVVQFLGSYVLPIAHNKFEYIE